MPNEMLKRRSLPVPKQLPLTQAKVIAAKKARIERAKKEKANEK